MVMETSDRSRVGVLHGHLKPCSPPHQAQIWPQAVHTVQHADAVVIGAGKHELYCFCPITICEVDDQLPMQA